MTVKGPSATQSSSSSIETLSSTSSTSSFLPGMLSNNSMSSTPQLPSLPVSVDDDDDDDDHIDGPGGRSSPDDFPSLKPKNHSDGHHLPSAGGDLSYKSSNVITSGDNFQHSGNASYYSPTKSNKPQLSEPPMIQRNRSVSPPAPLPSVVPAANKLQQHSNAPVYRTQMHVQNSSVSQNHSSSHVQHQQLPSSHGHIPVQISAVKENNNFGISSGNKPRDSPERTAKHQQKIMINEGSPQRGGKANANNVHTSSSTSVVTSSNGGVMPSVLTPIINDVRSYHFLIV